MDKDTKEIISNVLDLALKVIDYLEKAVLGIHNLNQRLIILEAKINGIK